jgi:hypothetical protein
MGVPTSPLLVEMFLQFHEHNQISKMAVFWFVAPCSLVEVYQRFRGPCCLHHKGDEWAAQSQSHIATDGQSASLSWCRAPFGTHDQMLSLSLTVTVWVVMSRPLWREGGSVICYLSWSLPNLYIFTFDIVQIYIHNTYNRLRTIHTWPLSVQAMCSRLCPILSHIML